MTGSDRLSASTVKRRDISPQLKAPNDSKERKVDYEHAGYDVYVQGLRLFDATSMHSTCGWIAQSATVASLITVSSSSAVRVRMRGWVCSISRSCSGLVHHGPRLLVVPATHAASALVPAIAAA